MSLETRQKVAKAIVARNASNRTDLLDPKITNTALIALLLDLIANADAIGKFLLVTAVRTDHHADGYLGPHSHEGGFAVDGWLLNSKKDGDYVSGTDPDFTRFLTRCALSPWLYNLGLAGEADTPENQAAILPVGFSDGGADHIHFSAQNNW